jgi:hypothetical protein
MKGDAKFIDGAANSMELFQDLWAEEADTSLGDAQAGEFDDVGFSICVLHRPKNNSFTINFIFTGQVFDFHFQSTR